MKIKILSGGKPKSEHAEYLKATTFYLNKLLNGNVKGINLTIKFKKMPYGVNGRACNRRYEDSPYKIEICKYITKGKILKTLAHECTHVKQYATGELKSKTLFENNRCKRILIWKGKEIRRSVYLNREWEIEARKMGEVLSESFTKLEKPIKKTVKNIFDKADIEKTVLETLSVDKLNSEFVSSILNKTKNTLEKTLVLKTIFNMKETGIIETYNINGLIWIRIKK